MSKPKIISELFIEMASDPNNAYGQVLRQMPFIQIELIRRGIISFDDLTDEQLQTIIDYDSKQK